MSLLSTPLPSETVLYGCMKLRIREIRKDKGLTLEQLAEMAGISRSYLNELELGAKTINVTRLGQVARALGVDAEDLIVPTAHHTAIPGKVGAGAPVHLTDDHAKGNGLYHIITPPQLIGKHAVAVEVEGDSMEPVYSHGDLLFYVRDTHEGVPTEAINRKVIAQTSDGKVWVKLLKHGSAAGKFNLLSINPTGDNMHDVDLVWASPVLMHLPADFVTRVK